MEAAIDWGSQGLVAYGCQSYVVVVDATDLSMHIQTLDEHRSPVVAVRWYRVCMIFIYICIRSLYVNSINPSQQGTIFRN